MRRYGDSLPATPAPTSRSSGPTPCTGGSGSPTAPSGPTGWSGYREDATSTRCPSSGPPRRPPATGTRRAAARRTTSPACSTSATPSRRLRGGLPGWWGFARNRRRIGRACSPTCSAGEAHRVYPDAPPAPARGAQRHAVHLPRRRRPPPSRCTTRPVGRGRLHCGHPALGVRAADQCDRRLGRPRARFVGRSPRTAPGGFAAARSGGGPPRPGQRRRLRPAAGQHGLGKLSKVAGIGHHGRHVAKRRGQRRPRARHGLAPPPHPGPWTGGLRRRPAAGPDPRRAAVGPPCADGRGRPRLDVASIRTGNARRRPDPVRRQRRSSASSRAATSWRRWTRSRAGGRRPRPPTSTPHRGAFGTPLRGGHPARRPALPPRRPEAPSWARRRACDFALRRDHGRTVDPPVNALPDAFLVEPRTNAWAVFGYDVSLRRRTTVRARWTP